MESELTQLAATGAGDVGNFSLLTFLIALPLFGAIALMFIPKEQKAAHWWTGIATSLVVFLVSIPLLTEFNSDVALFQWTQDFEWIEVIGAGWRVGLDGVSLWIVMLTTFLTPLILLGSTSAITTRTREFVIAMLVLESAMLGALVATDLLLFFLFWEMMLVPMYLIIGIWGGKERIYATLKFFIYTMIGSLLMLVGIIYLALKAGTFDYSAILALDLTETEQLWLFGGFALAFLIKVPLVPFHTWLPDAHTQAPTPGSVVLAGVLLKMGTYGLLRFAIPLFPQAMGTLSPVLLVLAVVGIVYGALLAYAQSDVKKLIAYSSVSHLGFVVLGIVAFNQQAVEGAILQMVNHGISTGGLFLVIGMLYERRHTRAIKEYGGIAAQVPILTAFFIVVTFSSIGVPATNGFSGEFLILSGTVKEALPVYPGMTALAWPKLTIAMAVLATTGVVLGAIYMLSMARRVFFGPLNPKNAGLKDLKVREIVVMAPLILFIFLIGLAPNLFLKPMKASVGSLLETTRPQVVEVRDKERLELQRRRGGFAADSGGAPAAAPEGAALQIPDLSLLIKAPAPGDDAARLAWTEER